MWQLQLESRPSTEALLPPMAQEPATHMSEPTPHKRPRSCVFRAGWARGAWDHLDARRPPLLVASEGPDHPGGPQGVGEWGHRTWVRRS